MTPGQRLYESSALTGIPWDQLPASDRAHWRRQAEFESKIQSPVIQYAAVAKPGDTIIIGFSHEVTGGEIDVLREQWQPLLDKGIEVAFTSKIASMVVFRPDLDGES